MGSVIATWRACTTDPSIHESVADYVQRIGQHHQLRRSQSDGSDVPMFSKVVTARRSEGLPPIPEERFFRDQTIQGKVVICTDLFPRSSDASEDEAGSPQSANAPAPLPDRLAAVADAKARGLTVVREGDTDYIVLEKATLFGADFRIFDPRDLYPGSDRMAFVFVRDSGWPLLDGIMVNVDDAASCKMYRAEIVKTADWQLSLPYVHLRYFLEDWSDRLFSWLRYFFIPGLEFWRGENNPTFGERDVHMAEMEQESGRAGARDQELRNLLLTYDDELEEWQGNLAAWAHQETPPPPSDEPSQRS